MDVLYPLHVIVRLPLRRDAARAFPCALAHIIAGPRLCYVFVIAIQRPAPRAGAAGDAVGRVPRSGHAEPFGGLWPQRDPARALRAARVFSARGFGQEDCLHPQRPAFRASVGS